MSGMFSKFVQKLFIVICQFRSDQVFGSKTSDKIKSSMWILHDKVLKKLANQQKILLSLTNLG